MKGIIITLGLILTIFGIASFAFNQIPLTSTEQSYQLEVFQMIHEKLNILAVIQPKVAAIIAAVGVVLIVYGFSRES